MTDSVDVGGLHVSHHNSQPSLAKVLPQQRAVSVPDLSPDTGKFGNPRLRWTILFTFLVFLIAFAPIWISLAIPDVIAGWIEVVIIALISLLWLTIAFCGLRNYLKLGYLPLPTPQGLAAARSRNLRHIVVVPCYLERLEMLFDCLSSLVLQKDTDSLTVVVSFEKGTPEVSEKVKAVGRAFGQAFHDLVVVVHSLDKAVEIAGACSNKNYGLRRGFMYVRDNHPDFDKTRYTCTTCDTDTKFHPQHFEALSSAYHAINPDLNSPPKLCVWQPPTIFNWSLDERPFYVRVTGIMRTLMMLGGLITFDLNPMSIFSYPLELGLTAGFVNPRYGVDDIILSVRWMTSTRHKIPIHVLRVPVISGPTSGVNWHNEAYEWGRQIRRWIIGSAESFHYFIVHWRGTPFLSGLSWFFMFFAYYGVLLCCAGVFQVLAGIPFPWSHDASTALATVGDHLIITVNVQFVLLVALGVQYFVFLIALGIDASVTSWLGIKEDINPIRNFFHWLVSPLVLLTYSIVALFAIFMFTIAGKKMAHHDMAQKEGLGVSTSGTNDEEAPALVSHNLIDIENGDSKSKEEPLLSGTEYDHIPVPEVASFGAYEVRLRHGAVCAWEPSVAYNSIGSIAGLRANERYPAV